MVERCRTYRNEDGSMQHDLMSEEEFKRRHHPYKENPQVRRAVTVEGKRYEVEALLLAWNVCRYGKLMAEMGVELGERFDEEKAIDLFRNNVGFYNSVKMCHGALMRANAGVAT